MLLMAGLALLPERVMRAVVGHFVRCTTAVLTNVVGPAVPYCLAGHALQRCTFWVPSAGDMGVGISLYSYCGTMGSADQRGSTPKLRKNYPILHLL